MAVFQGYPQIEVAISDYDIVCDEVCGRAVVDLAKMRDKFSDNLERDIWIDLEPQGKILLRGNS